jgi:hypothetical protein
VLDFPIALVDSEKTPDQHGNLRRDQKHFPGVSGRAQPNQLFAVQAPLPAISGCYPVLRIEIQKDIVPSLAGKPFLQRNRAVIVLAGVA